MSEIRATLNGVKETGQSFWLARSAPERSLLGGAALLLLLALIYATLLDPALVGRSQMEANLPALRQQAAEMQTLAREAAGLAGRSAPALTPVSKESLEASLARRGLNAQSISMTGDFARLQFSAVSFGALVNWLDEMQKNTRLSVVDANIVALATPGSVNASLTVRQPQNERE